MEQRRQQQQQIKSKALTLAFLVSSAEAFNVVQSLRAEGVFSRSSSSRRSGISSSSSISTSTSSIFVSSPWIAAPTTGSKASMVMSTRMGPDSSKQTTRNPNPNMVPPHPVVSSVRTLATLLAVSSMALGIILGAPRSAAAAEPATQMTTTTTKTARAAGGVSEIRYSDFINEVENGKMEKVSFSSDGTRLVAVDSDGMRVKMDAIPPDPELLSILTSNNVDVEVMPASEQGGPSIDTGKLILPAILLGALGAYVQTRVLGPKDGEGGEDNGDEQMRPPPPPGMGRGGPPGRGGMPNPSEFAKSKSKVQVNPDTGVVFSDVAGCDSAKLELEEVVDFLQYPDRYTEIGAKIPRGVLMEGPPGTGKTLLAKAVAGEAGVPFIAVSGSEFVEMYVGVGASRVRDMFAKAKENAPCIIFIDEIDAVGRQRGAGMAGGNDEREQTLNQILVQMDGFEGNVGIIVIAATNRADILDSALTRPGRFDRRVLVDLPDVDGRTAILKVHARGKPLAKDVDLEAIARRTPGFSGAQLQNLLNEAAIFTARKKRVVIEWDDVDRAVDRLMIGVEKKDGGGFTSTAREIVAYHEAGHAIIGALMPDYDMVQKVSIVPRTSGAGGVTFFSPSEQRLKTGMYSRQYLEAQLAVALGGRLAEELIYGEDSVTTGAQNDLKQVDNIARSMVTEWGFSPKVGPMVVGGESQSVGGAPPAIGSKLQKTVDDEVTRLTNNAYVTGKKILSENAELLEALAQRLLEQDQVTAEELSLMIMDAKAVTMAPYDVYGESKQYAEMPFRHYPAL